MIDQNIPEGMKNTFLYVAINGPAQPIEMIKQSEKITRNMAYDYCPKLAERKWFRKEELGKHRTGKPLTKYHLTVLGFSNALLLAEGEENVRNIIESWKELLPLVLGKWDLFIKENVEGKAFQKLALAASNRVHGGSWGPYVNLYNNIVTEAAYFTSDFYFVFSDSPAFNYLVSEGMDFSQEIKWIKICSKDVEIRDFLLHLIGTVQNSYKYLIKQTEVLTKVLYEEDVDDLLLKMKPGIAWEMKKLVKKHAEEYKKK